MTKNEFLKETLKKELHSLEFLPTIADAMEVETIQKKIESLQERLEEIQGYDVKRKARIKHCKQLLKELENK